jgi:hypothetical protein
VSSSSNSAIRSRPAKATTATPTDT